MAANVVSELKRLEAHYLGELSRVRAALAALGTPAPAPSRKRGGAKPAGPLQELALATLEESELTCTELAERLGVHAASTNSALVSLEKKKLVVRSGIGSKGNPYTWALRAKPEAAE